MTYQEANALVDDFSFVYKGESVSKEALIECREIIHTALEKMKFQCIKMMFILVLVLSLQLKKYIFDIKLW